MDIKSRRNEKDLKRNYKLEYKYRFQVMKRRWYQFWAVILVILTIMSAGVLFFELLQIVGKTGKFDVFGVVAFIIFGISFSIILFNKGVKKALR
jgi:hypothetical protein